MEVRIYPFTKTAKHLLTHNRQPAQMVESEPFSITGSSIQDIYRMFLKYGK